MSGLSRTNIQYELKNVQEKKIVKKVSCQILNIQVCICFDNQLKPHCYMADIGFKIKEKQSKWEKFKLFSSTAPSSKVRPQISLECLNSLI